MPDIDVKLPHNVLKTVLMMQEVQEALDNAKLRTPAPGLCWRYTYMQTKKLRTRVVPNRTLSKVGHYQGFQFLTLVVDVAASSSKKSAILPFGSCCCGSLSGPTGGSREPYSNTAGCGSCYGLP